MALEENCITRMYKSSKSTQKPIIKRMEETFVTQFMIQQTDPVSTITRKMKNVLII